MSNGEHTLLKNAIKQFLLRVDFVKSDTLKLAEIAEKMSAYFDRAERKQIKNFTVQFTQSSSELSGKDTFDFVLISEANNRTLTFSEVQNAFWIECNQYRDNSVYKDIINQIIQVLNELSLGTESKRIGLRYINEFKCNAHKDISKIYGVRLSTIVKQMLKASGQSRVIGVEEYNIEDRKLRLHYGVPNKFYPSVLTTYDLLMDIDSYCESTTKPLEWEDNIRKLNHAAYEKFVGEMNKKYLEELK